MPGKICWPNLVNLPVQGRLNSLLKDQGGLVDMAFSCWHRHCYETSGEVENQGGIQDMAILLQKTCLQLKEFKALCDQSFLNESAYSADESNVKVLFKHPSTTFVYTKT